LIANTATRTTVDAAEWNKALGLTQGANNSLLAVSIGKTNGRTNQSLSSNVKWRGTKLLSDVPSVLLHEGVIYLVKRGGIATTLNPETRSCFG
jgi:hypothetical protein